VDNETSSAKNENTVEIYFNEINDISDQIANTGTTGLRLSDTEFSILQGCANITFDTSSATVANPDTITVDFGNGCVGNDGKTRAGILRIIKTGPYFTTGTVITIIPDGYSVNGNILSGYRQITNTGVNSSGQPTFDVVVNASLTLANQQGLITWNANRTRTWIEGYDTPFIFSDDVISISGNSSGTKDNVSWSSQITSNLIFKRSCRQIVIGTLTLEPQDRP
ncbi:hypothetical protein EBU71_18230, partial [bacterium]|nr:hypothetical protein [Candidatus Elulimicrobium humile]